MATITSLSGLDGPLTHITVPLGRLMHERSFYACPGFMHTLNGEFKDWKTGRLQANQTPQEQLDSILWKWCSGKEMAFDRMMQDLMPRTDEVWEIKTADLRLFGWMYRPCVFVAEILGYADWYKPPTRKFSYEDARKRVIAVRARLDLDPPKFATGTFDALVRI